MHYILFYEVADDYIERRAAFRAVHLALATQAHQRGEMLLAGALADPADGAVFIFNGPTPAAAEAFAQSDPYVLNGLVKSWRVRNWNTVIGEGSTPVPSL